MLSIKSTFLVLTSLFILASLPGLISTESQILDCTNSTEPSSCLEKPNRYEQLATNGTIIKDNSSSTYRRDTGEVCANNNQENEFGSSVICLPKTHKNSPAEPHINQQESRKPVEVFIRTPNNVTQFDPGTSLTIECRFLIDSSILNQDFKFKLKWMRSVSGAANNQSITSTDTDSPLTIIAATTRLWTVQRNGGLDLELNNYQEEDAGNYFCQALTSDNTSSIISEAHVRLSLNQEISNKFPMNFDDPKEDGQDLLAHNLYSQETLAGLLPSLKVVPHFAEVPAGESIQLYCATSHLDPDPDPSSIEWSFESLENRKQLLHRTPSLNSQLPYNVSVLGNVLVVWSMSEEHCGIYKCTVNLHDFNLSAQASGEIVLRPTSDSAPLVFVSPEVVRLSPNGSTRIQCEATGYPPPEVVWYRVEAAQIASTTTVPLNLASSDDAGDIIQMDNGIVFEQIPYENSVLYCDQNRCQSPANQRSSVTRVSLFHVKQARAEHQGQWVCRASNKHGSNQASSVIDVEYREPPVVAIAPELREQTIILSGESYLHQKQHNVTFKCSVESGKPQPRLHWLRTANVGGGNINQKLTKSNSNLDLYDLTRISSATSNVSVQSEDRGRSLVLVVGTISLDDEGDYVCLGENEWGRHSAVAHLTVRQPASVQILQASPMLARPSDSFHLDCLATGHPAPLDIEWSRYDRGAFFSLISRSSSASSPRGGHERAVLKFDRVGFEDSGEYTCNARDPLNGSLILRDTIMVLIENGTVGGGGSAYQIQQISRANEVLFPKLMVRPTKITTTLGSNVTLDCLAVSGLQPTVVEWLSPQPSMDSASVDLSSGSRANQSMSNIWPYYRAGSPGGGQLVQFGSKLRILNVSKQHEGVYQCKGSNRMGVENAPALIRVLEPEVGSGERFNSEMTDLESSAYVAKTKVAKVGSNIELKCQVNGMEQPATSWSRDGLELPASSVQIEHNLWIQNVSQQDSGLYICSARSKLPNKVIQAKINLSVSGELDSDSLSRSYNLTAKIVASKNTVNVGDSLTLECIVTNLASGASARTASNHSKGLDLEEMERNVIWTNTHSGQGIFQDNVYVQHNLLIIYELRSENSATYRCNYNDFMQHTDYRLQVADSSNELAVKNGELLGSSSLSANNYEQHQLVASAQGHRAQLKQVVLGSSLKLECPPPVNGKRLGYRWTRGALQRPVGSLDSSPLMFETIRTSEADIYYCYYFPSNQQEVEPKFVSFIVQVLVPVARFVQRPVSFVSLPSISGANQQLEIELKFLPERDNGLLLFNGQRQWNRSAVGDYISLGMSKGFLEFRFELGDGTTLLRSIQSLTLNQWHRVLIERNRRGAVMWLDKQQPVSNSSAGKFFNLNLDSVLYVGGNQYFLNKSRQSSGVAANQSSARFYGYSRGFQGCVSLLRIGRNEINLMARNRSASIGIYECDKPECKHSECGSGGICQVDRVPPTTTSSDGKQSTVAPDLSAGQRCICPPGLSGEHCELQSSNMTFKLQLPATFFNASYASSAITPSTTSESSTTSSKPSGVACELLNPCSANGTQSCQSLTSTSYKCHCKLGFMGDTCSQLARFSSETSLWFNQQAYLQFRFNKPEEVQAYNNKHPTSGGNENNQQQARQQTANLTNFARLTSMAESQSISFTLQTRSSYGLIFYMGQAHSLLDSNTTNGMGLLDTVSQTSKSMVANLLARLSSIVFDYLAIALVDGHIELSYELGSGVAIIRSSERVNDGAHHQIRVIRTGRSARLTIDDLHKHDGSSPGKLSMLNSPPDIYLGGLPHLAELTHNMYMSGFVGCISNLQINSLGPINLIHSDRLGQVRSARNLAPCSAGLMLPSAASGSIVTSSSSSSTTKSPIQTTTKHRPYQSPVQPDNDDPDEM